MPFVKQIDRSATAAFCPHAPFLAAGTVAGAIDISFSTSSVLELFSLDFASNAESLTPCGTVAAPERFNRLAWGQHIGSDQSFPRLGLLAGGLADGSVSLWDPTVLLDPLAKEQHRSPLLAKMQKHTGAVKGLEFNSFSPNLLASGAADSDLCIWDLAKPSTPSLYPALKATGMPGGVRGLQRAPGVAANGDQNPGGAGTPGSAVGGEITYLAWNRKVQHILASCSTNGTTVVWDLKRQKPVISFRDPNSQRRASAIQWNPEIATQLIVASDDDRSPTLQMWDLRNSVSPLKEFVGHHKVRPLPPRGAEGLRWALLSAECWGRRRSGILVSPCVNEERLRWAIPSPGCIKSSSCLPGAVRWGINLSLPRGCCSPHEDRSAHLQGVLGMAWSPHDSSLLLSSGKDNRTICWDVHSGDTVCELTGAHWNFDVQWSPTVPGIFATSSFDGKLGICNLLGCTGSKVTETVNADFTVTHSIVGDATPLRKAPAWMKRPVGATFGFGGRLVSFTHNRTQHTDPATGAVRMQDTAVLSVRQVVTEQELVARSEGFEAAIQGGNLQTLREYCGGKRSELSTATAEAAEAPEASQEAETWAFLSVLFEGDDARRVLLQTLGFKDLPAREASMNGGGPGENGVDGAASAVEQLNLQTADGKASSDGHAHAPGHVSGGELESEVIKALTVGCYATAVEHCLTVHRYADALLIANTAGRELYQRTMHKYMQMCPHPYQAIIRANLEGDYSALIRTRPVAQWRETLAMLVTYTDRDKFRGLADTLASRLAQAGMHHEASLCWVCGGHTDQAVSYWARNCTGASGMTVEVLQSVIEKAVVMGMAPGVSTTSSSPDGVNKASQSLSELVTAYASLLASNGRMATALDYLEHVPGEASTTVAVLKDRIYRSGVAELPPGMHPPPFPFVRDELVPAAEAQAAKAAAAASYNSNYAAAGGYATAAAPAGGQYGGYGQQQAQQQQAVQQQQAQQQAAQQQAYNTSQGYNAGGYAQAQSHAYAPAPAAQQYNTAPAPQATAAAPQYGQQQQAAPYAAQAASQQAQSYYNQYQQPQQQQQQQAYAPATQQQQQAAPAYPGGASTASPYQQQRPAQPVAPAPAPFTPITSMAPPAVAQPQPMAPTPAAPQQSQYASAAAPMPAAYAPAPVTQQAAAAAPQPSFFVPSATTAAPVPAAASGRDGSFGGAPPPPAGHGMPPGGGMPAPASQRAAAPVVPPGPPANTSVATVDTSAVPAELRPVLVSLTNLFNTCTPLANNPAKKREMDDNTKKIGQLFWKLNSGEVSASVVPKLQQLCAAIDAGDWHTANHIQVQMTTTDWDECGFWLSAVKRMIKLRQTS
ncbi:Protein transport protein Sec31A [Tetrabaena socialis]|uniref:Protein transport protein Sec31A n=1 Tax=Tetrabaena socialis TaxID=47790 RepID=A0A2J8A175_9CHLO|nr:Protein transport protein Sec31A [Tetrabaena socialis]|eukprot:PNH06272.1 Protein transport protein Sec31A [Tetrabaena socialis]